MSIQLVDIICILFSSLVAMVIGYICIVNFEGRRVKLRLPKLPIPRRSPRPGTPPSQKRKKLLTPEQVQRPFVPTMITYEIMMAIVDEIIQSEWDHFERSFQINNMDRGITFEHEVKEMTSAVMRDLSPHLMRELENYLKQEYIISYVSRKVTILLEGYLQRRSAQNNGRTLK